MTSERRSARFVGGELVVDVLEHLARHLVAEDAGVDAVGEGAEVLQVPALQLLDVVLDVPHRVQVETGVVLASVERSDHALGRRLRGAPGQR